MNPLPGDIFARRLRTERERLGISQAELARRIASLLGTNVDPSAITRIEQQLRAVRLDEAVACAEVLDLPLVALVSEEGDSDTELQLQKHLLELTAVQHEWEKNRREIIRLSKLIHAISGGLQLHLETRHSSELLDAIDARVPADLGKPTRPEESQS